eukprot:COSAG01_NODE_679_length_14296_cov_250.437575_13_plen_120_part_00
MSGWSKQKIGGSPCSRHDAHPGMHHTMTCFGPHTGSSGCFFRTGGTSNLPLTPLCIITTSLSLKKPSAAYTSDKTHVVPSSDARKVEQWCQWQPGATISSAPIFSSPLCSSLAGVCIPG